MANPLKGEHEIPAAQWMLLLFYYLYSTKSGVQTSAVANKDFVNMVW